MAKIKVDGNTISGSVKDITDVLNKVANDGNTIIEVPEGIEIHGGKIKALFCNYSYSITDGPTAGDIVPNRKGAGIIHDDMIAAFQKLNIHLAVICEEISPSEIDIENLPDVTDETLKGKEKQLAKKVDSFIVSEFRIDGTGENEGVILVGTKTLSTSETVKLETPKVKFDSTYDFVQELAAAVSECQNEVALYMNGKMKPKMIQGELGLEDTDDDDE